MITGQKALFGLFRYCGVVYRGHSLLTEDEGVISGEDDYPWGREGKYFEISGRIKKSEIIKDDLIRHRVKGVDRVVFTGSRATDTDGSQDGHFVAGIMGENKRTMIEYIKKLFDDSSSRNRTKKVSIIGMGYVGAGIAYALMIKDIAREIVFIDVKDVTVNAEMLDIRHGMHNMGSAEIKNGTYGDIKDSDLIIITAGRNRREGETRLDLTDDNIKIADKVIAEVKKYYNRGVILVVSNPVDIITYYVTKKMGLAKGRVFGTGCILDTSRLINVISDYVGLGSEFISATVAGEHGTNQIPLWSGVEVAQIPIETYCKEIGLKFDDEIKNKMARKVRNMGAEIIQGKGKTYYGISTCVCYLADAILNKRPTVASVTSVLDGVAGLNDVALSLPSIIDYNGVKRILPVNMNEYERKQLAEAASKLKDAGKRAKI